MTAILAASALLAALLAGVALLLLRGRRRRIEAPEDAALAAEASLPGFRAADAVLGADGFGALVVSGDGRVAAAIPRGRRLRVREVGWTALRPTPDGVVVEARGLGRVVLAGVDALDVRRLAGAGGV